ncbi:MAG: non-canonical purine NTP pyrophosphatase, partial [Limisphaerales bacterium]
PEGETRSFAELGASVKNRISHRARALAALWNALREG